MSKKDMDNYIKDVQEGGIIDPGHVREMNMLAYLGTLLAYLGVLGVVTAAKARDVDPIVMFTACYYKWLKDGNLKRLGKFRTKSPNEGAVQKERGK